jgi:hypothetical protein
MSEQLRHFIAYIALGVLIAGLVAVAILLFRNRKAQRRTHTRRPKIDLLSATESTE